MASSAGVKRADHGKDPLLRDPILISGVGSIVKNKCRTLCSIRTSKRRIGRDEPGENAVGVETHLEAIGLDL